MKFQAAMIDEKGIRFAIVAVQWPVLAEQSKIARIIKAVTPAFPKIPIILMAINARGVPIFYGRQDIVNFLTQIPVDRIPWKVFEAPDPASEEESSEKKSPGKTAGNTTLHS